MLVLLCASTFDVLKVPKMFFVVVEMQPVAVENMGGHKGFPTYMFSFHF